MRAVIADLRGAVTGGLSFSQALAQHPEVFPPAYVHIVAAGEQGGFVHQVLQRLRELDEKRRELRSTLVSAFSYPAFLVVFSVAVVAFVLIVVFPKFAELFELIRDQLPITTRFLMVTSQGLRQYWIPLLLAAVTSGILCWGWLRRPEGRAALDRLVLRLPVIREMVVLFHLVQFMYVMSLALGNGVPMLQALRSCREIVSSVGFRRFVEHLETCVNEGRGIAAGFEEADFVPPLIQQMVRTGEETGGLAMVMGRMAEFYEREWKTRLTTAAKLVEPAMLVVMGVVVGLIVSSLILPIFKLSRTVH
jgi:type II secretory pathway component PulF